MSRIREAKEVFDSVEKWREKINELAESNEYKILPERPEPLRVHFRKKVDGSVFNCPCLFCQKEQKETDEKIHKQVFNDLIK